MPAPSDWSNFIDRWYKWYNGATYEDRIFTTAIDRPLTQVVYVVESLKRELEALRGLCFFGPAKSISPVQGKPPTFHEDENSRIIRFRSITGAFLTITTRRYSSLPWCSVKLLIAHLDVVHISYAVANWAIGREGGEEMIPFDYSGMYDLWVRRSLSCGLPGFGVGGVVSPIIGKTGWTGFAESCQIISSA